MLAAADGGLDELRQGEGTEIQRLILGGRPRCAQRLLVVTEAILQHGRGVLRERDITPEPSCDCVSHVRLCKRSEEHTSELQSRRDLVCRLLLEKKKKIRYTTHATRQKKKTHTSSH